MFIEGGAEVAVVLLRRFFLLVVFAAVIILVMDLGTAVFAQGNGSWLVFRNCSLVSLAGSGGGVVAGSICRDGQVSALLVSVNESGYRVLAHARVMGAPVPVGFVRVSYSSGLVVFNAVSNRYVFLLPLNGSYRLIVMNAVLSSPTIVSGDGEPLIVGGLGASSIVVGKPRSGSLEALIMNVGVRSERLGAVGYWEKAVAFVTPGGIYVVNISSLALLGYVPKTYSIIVPISCSYRGLVAGPTDKSSLLVVNGTRFYEIVVPPAKYTGLGCARGTLTLLGVGREGIEVLVIDPGKSLAHVLVINRIPRGINVLQAVFVPGKGLYLAGLMPGEVLPEPFVAYIPLRLGESTGTYLVKVLSDNGAILFQLIDKGSTRLSTRSLAPNVERTIRASKTSFAISYASPGEYLVKKKPGIELMRVELTPQKHTGAVATTTSTEKTATKTTTTTAKTQRTRTRTARESATRTPATSTSPSQETYTGNKTGHREATTRSTTPTRPATQMNIATHAPTNTTKTMQGGSWAKLGAITVIAASIVAGVLYGRFVARRHMDRVVAGSS